MNANNQLNTSIGISTKQAAKVTGFGLLVMTIFAVFADIYIFSDLIIEGNLTLTSNNIISNELLFRIGIFCYIIVIILDIIVASGLYILLKPINKNISLLAAWLRLMYASIFAIALTEYLNVLQFDSHRPLSFLKL